MNSRLITDVALAFADHEEFGTQLSRALKSLCTGMQLSRAYVFIDGQNRTTMGYTHEWCAEGIAQQWMHEIPYSSYDSWKRMLTENGRIVSVDTMTLPDDLKKALESSGIKSLQAYPIEFDQQIVGFAGFDDCLHQRQWTDDESDVLKAASAIFSGLCEREILREHVRIENEIPETVVEEGSIHDPLTGIYNKRYVIERLAGFDAEYARLGRNFCVSTLDIDHFKSINERHGREAGDFVLKEFAAIVHSSIRPYDISGRYADDEFIIVSVNASALETGYLIGRIMSAVKSHIFNYGGIVMRITFSYGISDSSEFSTESISVDKMVELADQRLHAAREEERNKKVEPSLDA